MRVLCSLLATLLFTATAFAGDKYITLEDVWKNGTFRMKSVPGFNALQDGTRFTRMDREDTKILIQVYDLAAGYKLTTLFDNSLQKYNGATLMPVDYAFSHDEEKMLLFTERKAVYRHSALYKVYVYDPRSKTLKILDQEPVMHATFSPDGTKVAFVKNNNLYYRNLLTQQTTAITVDGKWNEIINGNCDWVYEEEFSFTRAYQWSPDGSHIAYYRFDETKVPEYTMPLYNGLYPQQYTYKYPKAGEPNADVRIMIHQLRTNNTVTAASVAGLTHYIPRIKWTKDAGKLCIFRLNRNQNHLEFLLADASTGTTKRIYEEKNRYYIDINDNLHFLPDQASFVFTSEMNGYNHIWRWNWKQQKKTALTSGKFDVDELAGIDEATGTIYYSAATNPTVRQLYAVSWQGKNRKLLTPEPGTHHTTAINGFQYFLDKHSSLDTPPIYYLRDKSGKIVRTLEDNRNLAEKLQEYNLGKVRLKQIPGATPGVLLNAWIITPPDFSSDKQYPVLMFQYSGPGSQQVADKFPIADYFWHQMLAQKGYIIVCTDGTGTGFRGEAFRKETYLTLGKKESDDQIAVARYLGGQPYVDRNRIGIWGWSYGGFISSTCILKGNDVFKAAIAVAPVSNWRYYDNIYTERYMRTPEENAQGYDENAPEKMADKLKGKFLLIHGTADDNVHVQHAIMLADALIKAGREFDSEYYPDRNHGIYGGNTRYHLYQRMTKFILENL